MCILLIMSWILNTCQCFSHVFIKKNYCINHVWTCSLEQFSCEILPVILSYRSFRRCDWMHVSLLRWSFLRFSPLSVRIMINKSQRGKSLSCSKLFRGCWFLLDHNTIWELICLFNNRSSLSGHSRSVTSVQLYLLRPPWQNPVWTLAHTNAVYTFQ